MKKKTIQEMTPTECGAWADRALKREERWRAFGHFLMWLGMIVGLAILSMLLGGPDTD